MADLMKAQNRSLSIKIIAIGSIGCGKTSIIRRHTHGHFLESYKATIGVDFQRTNFELPHTGTIVDLNLWDLAGDERFGSMTSIYYRNAKGVLIVFDVTREKTFKTAIKWYKDLINRFQSYEDAPVILFVANKIDIGQKFEYIDIENLIRKEKSEDRNNIIGIIETSAKENIGVDEAMKTLLASIESRMDIKDLDQCKSDPIVLNDKCCQ